MTQPGETRHENVQHSQQLVAVVELGGQHLRGAVVSVPAGIWIGTGDTLASLPSVDVDQVPLDGEQQVVVGVEILLIHP